MIPAFKEIEGSTVVLVGKNGLFHQSKCYEFSGTVFARMRGGFARLYANGASSVPGLRWTAIDVGPDGYHVDTIGRMALGPPMELPRAPQRSPKGLARIARALTPA